MTEALSFTSQQSRPDEQPVSSDEQDILDESIQLTLGLKVPEVPMRFNTWYEMNRRNLMQVSCRRMASFLNGGRIL
jgi:hypothetical protein